MIRSRSKVIINPINAIEAVIKWAVIKSSLKIPIKLQPIEEIIPKIQFRTPNLGDEEMKYLWIYIMCGMKSKPRITVPIFHNRYPLGLVDLLPKLLTWLKIEYCSGYKQIEMIVIIK